MQSFVLTYSPFAKRPCTENAKDRSFDTSNDSGIGRSFNTSADSGIGRSFDTSNNSTIGRPFDNSTDSGIGRSLDTSNNAGIGRSFIDSPPPFKPPSTMIYRTSPILRSPLSASGAINSPTSHFLLQRITLFFRTTTTFTYNNNELNRFSFFWFTRQQAPISTTFDYFGESFR
ncbi:hypothetical protein M3Y94_00274600 [Aphelenchoides besseyi]|nr:hypothetical protein M3Y94_00274600 [Aphelenchoides besseyi]